MGNDLAHFLMGTIFLVIVYVCIVFSMVRSHARLGRSSPD